MQITTGKYISDHKKHRYQLVDEPKKQINWLFKDKDEAIKIIMDCRITAAHKFRTSLGFKQHDVILTKKLPVMTKIRSLFEGENMQKRNSVIGYRIHLCFNEHKLPKESGHSDRNTDYGQKVIDQGLGCEFIRIDPEKNDFNIFKVINEIFEHIKQSSNQLTK